MFSVIIPLFNKRAFVKRAIDSVFSQTFQDFEVIVVDDGSTDGGGDFVKEFYGNQIKLIKQANAGVSVARNTAITQAKFPWVAFLDADDYWSPYFLEKNWEIISLDENIKIIGSQYCLKSDDLELLNYPTKYRKLNNYFKNAINNYLFTSSSTVVSRMFFEKNQGFKPYLKSGEDLDVWFRVNLWEGNAYFIHNILAYYSSEDNSRLSKKQIPFEGTFVFNLKSFLVAIDKENLKIRDEFEEFIDKLIYESLRTRYYLPESHVAAREILKLKNGSYLLAELYYKLPFKLGLYLVTNNFFNLWIRKYFKFLFRIVYK